MVDFNAADIIVPDGKLDAGWFQGKTPTQVVQMIAGFVDDIPSQIAGLDDYPDAQTRAIEAWAYGQSFLFLKADYGSRTGTVSLSGEITAQTTKEAATTFGELADYWLGIFYGLVPTASPLTNRRPKTVSLTARFRA
jgi:hypothetical protein